MTGKTPCNIAVMAGHKAICGKNDVKLKGIVIEHKDKIAVIILFEEYFYLQSTAIINMILYIVTVLHAVLKKSCQSSSTNPDKVGVLLFFCAH